MVVAVLLVGLALLGLSLWARSGRGGGIPWWFPTHAGASRQRRTLVLVLGQLPRWLQPRWLHALPERHGLR